MIIGHWSYFLENIYFKYRTKKLYDEDSFFYFPILKTPHDPAQRTPLVSTIGHTLGSLKYQTKSPFKLLRIEPIPLIHPTLLFYQNRSVGSLISMKILLIDAASNFAINDRCFKSSSNFSKSCMSIAISLYFTSRNFVRWISASFCFWKEFSLSPRHRRPFRLLILWGWIILIFSYRD